MIDGDTFRQGRERFRLENIDAPEMGNGARCDAERYLAEVAKEHLAAFLARGPIAIERRGKDQFGRTLAFVRVMGADAGEKIFADRTGRARAAKPPRRH